MVAVAGWWLVFSNPNSAKRMTMLIDFFDYPKALACTFNQVLQRQPARLQNALKSFQGKTVRFALESPSIELVFCVNPEGKLEAVDESAALVTDVSIRLQGRLPLPPISLDGLLAKAHIAGNAELAEALAFVLKNISLKPGDLLQPVLGDILTHRVEQALTCGGQHLFSVVLTLAQKLSR